MRSLICISLFGLCLTTVVVSALEPAEKCCKLKDSDCSADVTKDWLKDQKEPDGTPEKSNIADTQTCVGVKALDNPAPQYADAAWRFKCATAVLYKPASITNLCPPDPNSKTGSMSSVGTKLCKELNRCMWDTDKGCITKTGYPKEYKVNYYVINPNCGDEKLPPGGGD